MNQAAPAMPDPTPILRVQDLRKSFAVGGKKRLHAVDGVRFRVQPGETLGLVGESGCGKSTVGNLVLGLIEADGGDILYKGTDIVRGTRPWGKIQAVFQDPQSSLDPRMTVEKIVEAPLLPFSGLSKAERKERVGRILAEVGLGDEHRSRYPHEFSGGQRQRIGIARALVVEPEFVVFDEPTSALDVSVQAQILNLIMKLQQKYGYAYLFISHDLAVVRHVSHRVAVMYLGHVVETARREDLFKNPLHPYTKALMDSVPEPDPARRKPMAVLQGDVPSPVDLPPGCPFEPRCPQAMPACRKERPERILAAPQHFVECRLYPGC